MSDREIPENGTVGELQDGVMARENKLAMLRQMAFVQSIAEQVETIDKRRNEFNWIDLMTARRLIEDVALSI
jgi:hypothetical protein